MSFTEEVHKNGQQTKQEIQAFFTAGMALAEQQNAETAGMPVVAEEVVAALQRGMAEGTAGKVVEAAYSRMVDKTAGDTDLVVEAEEAWLGKHNAALAAAAACLNQLCSRLAL